MLHIFFVPEISLSKFPQKLSNNQEDLIQVVLEFM